MTLNELIDMLARQPRVAVLTGSGISAESGIPTFRGADGLWKQFRAEELATPEAFRRDPKLVWEWYRFRRQIIREAEPNAGHLALAEMEKRLPHFVLITQNVDGLHQRSGSRKVIELHGNIFIDRCVQCGKEVDRSLDPESNEEIPHCECGGLFRPGVVWFGETLPPDALDRAWNAAEQCEVFFSIGTSAVVYPAAGLPELAHRRGARVVEINPEATAVSVHADLIMRESAAKALPEIVAHLQSVKPS